MSDNNSVIPDIEVICGIEPGRRRDILTPSEKLDLILAQLSDISQRVTKLETLADVVISMAQGMENNPMFKMFLKKK